MHRLTHRVVRGGLLICGRPDGRLMALTTSESSTCLSTSQASSIVSIFASSLESITIGHNPCGLGLASGGNVFLKSHRKEFLCEAALKKELGVSSLAGRSSGMLLGDYGNWHKKCLGVFDGEGTDVMEMLSSISTKTKVSQAELDQRRKEKAKFKSNKRANEMAAILSKKKGKETCYGEQSAAAARERGENDFEIAEKQQLAMRL